VNAEKPARLLKSSGRRSLGKTLGYVTSTEKLSLTLQDLPQSESTEIWFSTYATGEEREARIAAIEERRAIPVADLHYAPGGIGRSTSKAFIEAGMTEPHWTIRLQALPRELLGTARRTFTLTGLSLVNHWLSMPRTPVWLSTAHTLRLFYDPKLDAIFPEVLS
jgi:hypothetical protein